MKLKKIAALIALAGLSGSAFATNGYFSHGVGIKAKGMAGVGIALPQDSLAAGTNPAGMVLVGDRLDVGIDWFSPDRHAEIVGNNMGPAGSLDGRYKGNGMDNFLIPEFGYNKMLGWDMAVGISMYGNGGMNTHYNRSPFAAAGLGFFGGTNPGGVNLSQLFITPTFAMRINKQHSLGVSIVIAHQRFAADGLQAFDNPGFTAYPGKVTNRGGYAKDTNVGLRLGWNWQVNEALTLGATYASKIDGQFSEYKGLFAGKGGFDIPENYGIGIAYKATPKLTLAADIQQINFSKTNSVGNKVDCLFVGACQLGNNNGAGFGWDDVTAYKFGASYEYSPQLTFRAGFSTTDQPIPKSQTFFNILAPAVVEDHVTLGGTWTLANKNELTVGYMHAFEKKVKGSGSIPAMLGGGEANLKMSEDSLGIAYGIKF
jgi:long-chain fatty acid transport protein